MIANLFAAIPLFYLAFGAVLYRVGANSGKLDDVLLAAILILFSLKTRVNAKAIMVFVLFLGYVVVFSVVNNINVNYWIYLFAVWVPIVFARPPERPNRFAFAIFFISYSSYLILHFNIGSSRVKTLNIDINVFNVFATLTAVYFLKLRFFTSSSFVLISSILSGSRSSIASALMALNRYRSGLFVFSLLYIGLYFFVLTQLSSNPANLARYHLLLNHLANYLELTPTELIWGAGPLAYSEQVVLIDTTVKFVTNKPKTVDSSLLRMFLEFGAVPTLIILICLLRYLRSVPLFIFYLILFGMNNEGMLSVYGPMSLLMLKSLQGRPTQLSRE